MKHSREVFCNPTLNESFRKFFSLTYVTIKASRPRKEAYSRYSIRTFFD